MQNSRKKPTILAKQKRQFPILDTIDEKNAFSAVALYI